MIDTNIISMEIDADDDDFDDGRMATDVHYESDQNDEVVGNLNVDLIQGNLSDRKRSKRPLSATKRSRTD